MLKLAQDESLGTFILVMANGTFDENIYSAVKNVLAGNFCYLKEKFNNAFKQGNRINDFDEDLLVFHGMN